MEELNKKMCEISKKIAETNANKIQKWLEDSWVTKQNSEMYTITHKYKRVSGKKTISHERLILKYCGEFFSELEIKLTTKI